MCLTLDESTLTSSAHFSSRSFVVRQWKSRTFRKVMSESLNTADGVCSQSAAQSACNFGCRGRTRVHQIHIPLRTNRTRIPASARSTYNIQSGIAFTIVAKCCRSYPTSQANRQDAYATIGLHHQQSSVILQNRVNHR